MTIQNILDTFNKNYNRLYENGNNDDRYDIAINYFDTLLKTEKGKALISELIQARGDIFSSDREAAAIGITLSECNIRIFG